MANPSVRQFLFAGDIDPTTRQRTSLFSNALVLPGFNDAIYILHCMIRNFRLEATVTIFLVLRMSL